MSLIKKSFQKCKIENRPALLTYTVAGDNSKIKSLEILNKISKYADICELGFPHNTPIADGGQIQTSSYRAIKNGIKIKDVFDIVKTFKAKKKSRSTRYLIHAKKNCFHGDTHLLGPNIKEYISKWI